MAELRLKFSGEELVETGFDHPLLHSPRRAVRGKTSGAYTNAHSFQWTPALQTLCSLLLRTAAWDCGKNQPAVAGTSGSGAAALDYAISREVDWIHEIFGSDSKGNSIAKRLFRRTNPERKRPGPVVISLNPDFMDPGQIKVYLEEREATREVSLLSLASHLEDRLAQKKPNRLPRKKDGFPLLQHSPWRQRLAEGFRKEIRQMLRSTDIFNRSRSFSLLQQLQENPSFIRIAGHPTSLVSDLDLNLTGAHRLGSAVSEAEIRNQLCQSRPITFGVTPSQSGTIAILYFLKYWKGYNIRILYHFAHTSEMVLGMTTGGGPDFPDCCAISVASAGTLFQRKGEYHSLMMIPAATHRVVAPRTRSPQWNRGRYIFLNEIPTTPSFYFEELADHGHLKRNQVQVVHKDPDETTRLLAEGDPELRAILWFPYPLVNEMFNGTVTLPAPTGQCDSLCNLLFVHDSLMKDRARVLSLDIAIRDAWLDLICDDSLLEAVLQRMLSNGAYLKFLARCSGLHNLDLESKRGGGHSVWQNLHL